MVDINYLTINYCKKESCIQETPNLSSNFFLLKKNKKKNNPEQLLVLRFYELVHQSITTHVWTFHGCDLEQLLVFKSLRVGQGVHQSNSQTPPTSGRSTFAIQNNSLFLGLYVSVNECTSPLCRSSIIDSDI